MHDIIGAGFCEVRTSDRWFKNLCRMDTIPKKREAVVIVLEKHGRQRLDACRSVKGSAGTCSTGLGSVSICRHAKDTGF